MKETPPGESVPNPAHLAVESKTLPQSTQFTESVTSRIGESVTQQAQNNHNPQQGPDTQDANMKDAPSCEKCGQIFPWNQLHLKWMHKCTASAECGESVAKPPTSVAKCKMVPQSGPSTTSRIGELDTQLAATDGDATSCKTCGQTFSQKERHLLVNHKCEPTEVIYTPDPPQRHATYSASNPRRPMSMHVANKPHLVDKGSLESDTQDANMKDAPSCEKCGQIFPWNQPQLKWKHECTRSAESGKSIAKAPTSVAKCQTLTQSSQSRNAGPSTTSRICGLDTQLAATNGDATSCKTCGQTFSQKEKHLLVNHKCEPTEVIHTPDPLKRRATYSASNPRRPMSMHVTDKPHLVDKGSLESDTQDENMKDAPSCEKCGQIFPWNQRQLKWKHECTRSAESGDSVAKAPTSVAKCQTLTQSSQSRNTGPSNTSRNGGLDTQLAATDEDAHICKKYGLNFSRKEKHLLGSQMCEPTEEVHARRAKPSASNAKSSRPVTMNVAEKQQLFASHTADPAVKKDTTGARNHLQCECGRTFAKGQKGEFMMHKAQCRKEDP